MSKLDGQNWQQASSRLQQFEELGLSRNEALVYELLLREGSHSASQLSSATSISRPNTYNVLGQLEEMKLVSKRKEGSKTAFHAEHPRALEELLAAKKEKIDQSQQQLASLLPNLVSEFSLAERRPGVFRFEGREGLYRVYDELLRDGVTVNTIVERGKLRSFIADYNPGYIKQRKKRGILSRVITPSDEIIEEDNSSELRKVRYLDKQMFPFGMDFKVTEYKVVLTTLLEDSAVGVIIADQEITRNFLVLYDFLWEIAREAPAS